MAADELATEAITSYVTKCGRVDIFRELLPGQSFDELSANSVGWERLSRDKDRAQLPALYAARDELRQR